MKFELEQETKWDIAKQESVSTYWVKVDGKCIDLSYDYEHAVQKYKKVKENYIAESKRVILSEEVEGTTPIPDVTKLLILKESI